MNAKGLEIKKLLPDAVKVRHDLHAHPELGYQEHRTSGVIQKHLADWGIEYVAGLAGGTGVLARIPATGNRKATVGLRADMDALPIVEETGCEYSSTHHGVMHACGHDGHTTILLTTARLLSQIPDRPNEILFLFQPAEEGGAGAKKMCLDGVLKGGVLGGKVDYIFGLHGHPTLPVGEVTTRIGPMLAAACAFKIVVLGKGCHAAAPHTGIDPIVVTAHIVTALQTIASRNVDPLDSVVVTIGKIDAGVAHNVIPESATLTGTLRTLSEETDRLAKSRLEKIVHSVAEAFGADANVEWEANPYPVTRNDATATSKFREVAARLMAPEKIQELKDPVMGGEDFSFYGLEVPACFFFLGLIPTGEAKYPNLHSPHFDFNDSAIPLGVELMAELALQPL